MITLYELHWSHYCEKIRWALDYKKMAWKKVNINAFTKQEMKKFSSTQQRYLVPLIYDSNTKMSVGDSSPILRYLEDAYPQTPRLFSSDMGEKEVIYKLLIELDSKLGVIARRLGYTQIILEKPTILPQLFLADIYRGFFNLPGIRRISAAFLGMVLIKRFGFELNESLYLYEELEKYLLSITQRLKGKKFLVNDNFSAADITLAVYLRPLLIVPYFREHSCLTSLFEWQENILREHKRETKLLYQVLIEKHREHYFPIRRNIRNSLQEGFFNKIEEEIDKSKIAYNDHEPIWTWRLWMIPYYYFFKIKKNKLRQKEASETVR